MMQRYIEGVRVRDWDSGNAQNGGNQSRGFNTVLAKPSDRTIVTNSDRNQPSPYSGRRIYDGKFETRHGLVEIDVQKDMAGRT